VIFIVSGDEKEYDILTCLRTPFLFLLTSE